MYNKKYIVKKIEEFRRHNPLYDDMEGHVCYLAYLNVGERGWFLHEQVGDMWPHRIHTTEIEDITVCGDNQVIIVTTQNTRFTFEEIESRRV